MHRKKLLLAAVLSLSFLMAGCRSSQADQATGTVSETSTVVIEAAEQDDSSLTAESTENAETGNSGSSAGESTTDGKADSAGTEDDKSKKNSASDTNTEDSDKTSGNSADESGTGSDNNSVSQNSSLTAEEKEALRGQLTIMQDPGMYTYDDMLSDTDLILKLYPDLVTKDSIGTTADGREIVHYVVGNPNAEKQIFINAAIHAREYLTFQLVMKQMCVYLQHVDQNDVWADLGYRDMWNQVAIHVVPLINPDGVQISQFGLDGIQNPSIREGIYQLAANDGTDVTPYYLDHWKANALGVDLNRNFDAYWEYYAGTGYPSSDHYKGTAPGSEAEAAALIQLTEANNFLYTISYHTQGQVIYWNFENIDPVYDIALQWVNRIQAQTGYSPINDFSTVDPAGYSDWAIYRHQIPSVVIEVASGDSPYLSNQFQNVWDENQNIWELTVQEALYR